MQSFRFQKLFRIRKLATRFLLTTLAIAIVIVTAMSLALFKQNSPLFQEQINKGIALQADVITAKMDEELQQKFTEIESLAMAGQQLGLDVQKHTDLMNNFFKDKSYYITPVFSLDMTGKNVISPSTGQKIDVTDREYFKSLVQGKAVISDPVQNKTDPTKLTIVYAVPLMKDGKPFGFYLAASDINTATALVQQTKIGQTGYATLVDSKGTIISHPDVSLIMKKTVYDLNIPEVISGFEAAKKGSNTSYTYTYGGIQKAGYSEMTKNGFVVQMSVPLNEAMAPVTKMMKTTIEIALIVTAAALAITYVFATRMAKPIVYITGVVQTLSQGDLRPRLQVKTNDELGQLAANMNLMLDSFSRTIGQASQAAEQVAASSEELTAVSAESVSVSTRIVEAIQHVVQAGENQMQGVNQTSTAMEEMSVGVQRIAESSSVVAEASDISMQEIQHGQSSIQQAIGQMRSIKESVSNSAEDMRSLEAYSLKIGEIVSLISSITKQTQLLSLNASIEAARAGEQGRGFAVVANEVKNLAEQSATSAATITQLIEEVQASTSRAALAMNKGVQDVEKGFELIDNAGEVFERITTGFREITDQIREVSAAAQEMSSGTEEVTASMNEITNMTQQTYTHSQHISEGSQKQFASMEDISSSAEDLSQMALQLQEALAKFRTS